MSRLEASALGVRIPGSDADARRRTIEGTGHVRPLPLDGATTRGPPVAGGRRRRRPTGDLPTRGTTRPATGTSERQGRRAAAVLAERHGRTMRGAVRGWGAGAPTRSPLRRLTPSARPGPAILHVRICLVSPIFPPYPPPASLRTHSFAATWADFGHEVTVVTTRKPAKHRLMPLPCPGATVIEVPYRIPAVLRWARHHHDAGHPPPDAPEIGSDGDADRTLPRNGISPEPRVSGGAVPREDVDASPRPVGCRCSRDGLVGGFRELRRRTGIYGGMRMPDLTDHWVRGAIRAARARGPYDVVVSSSGPYTAHRVAEALRTGGDASLWIGDYRDLWTSHPAFRGLPPFCWRERQLERRWLRTMDLVTTVSEGLAADLRPRAKGPVHVVPNGVDPERLRSIDPAPIFPADGWARIIYTGTVYPPHQDMTPLLAALARLRGEGANVPRLVVAGHETEPWRAAAARHGVTDLLELHGWVDHGTSMRMQRDADALVILDWDDPARGMLTSKIFEYVVAGPPVLVIGGCGTDASPIVRFLHEAGRDPRPGRDVASVAANLREIVMDAARRNTPDESPPSSVPSGAAATEPAPGTPSTRAPEPGSSRGHRSARGTSRTAPHADSPASMVTRLARSRQATSMLRLLETAMSEPGR